MTDDAGQPNTAAGQTDQGAPAGGSGTDSAPAAIEYQPWKLPDGWQVDESVLGSFTEFAKGKQLNQDEAQGLVDLFSRAGSGFQEALKTSMTEEVQQSLLQQHEDQVKAWEAETKAADDIGGEKFHASMAVAQKAIGMFASPGFKQLMETLGIGNHPEVVRTFVAIGSRVSEGGFVPAGGNAPPVKPTEAIYNHPTSKAALRY